MHAEVDLSDRKSLQRGARTFVNYCLSCHSASFMRYNRLGPGPAHQRERAEGELHVRHGQAGRYHDRRPEQARGGKVLRYRRARPLRNRPFPRARTGYIPT